MPEDYVLLTINIGDEYARIALGNPAHQVEVAVTRSLGDRHFEANNHVPLKVPSVISHRDSNFIFSAAYAESHAKIVATDPVWLDPRLWSKSSLQQ